MALKSTHEPTVPLSELLGSLMDLETARAYGAVAGVEVLVDYLDRPAVTLADAYKLGEARRKAEREYHEAESRRLTEHANAVRSLQAAMDAEFTRVRDETMKRLAGHPHFEGAQGTRGEAINEALAACRALWHAAPPLVRQEITTVNAFEGDYETTIDLNMIMPKQVLDAYIRRLAAKN